MQNVPEVEEARLLYIAMTRAINQLVMTGDRNSEFMKRVEGVLEKTGLECDQRLPPKKRTKTIQEA